ncbi:MobV family relaxase [Pasteurella multocida]
MSFAILRTTKLKDWGNISASLQHTFRERLTPNADETRTGLNAHIGGNNSEQVLQKIKDGLPDKYRADCVKCVEYLITASPEWFAQANEQERLRYFHTAQEWLKERHGADNVKYVGIHVDETTPHLVAYVVPIDEKGRLNCKAFLGGREKLSKMQSDFAERVQKFGLKRGVEGSKAKHQRVKRFYGHLEQETPRMTMDDITPKLLKKGLFQDTYEDDQVVVERVNAKMQAILDHKTAQINDLRQKLGETQAKLQKTQQELSKMRYNEQMKLQQEKLKERQKNRSVDDLKRSKGVSFGR